MLDYRFELNGSDITEDILNFEYSENLDDVASNFSFTSNTDFGLTSNVNNKTVLNELKIINKNNNAFYLGYIADYEHTTDKNIYSYSGFDVGFYLNKNEVIIQFRNEKIFNALEKLSRENEVKIGFIGEFKQKVSKIYKDVLFADVIKDLIKLEKDKGGAKDFYIDCKDGFLNIRQYVKEEDLTSLIGNGFLVKSDKTYSNVSVKQSIQELKNRVIYSNNNEKSLLRVIQQDNNSISTYGLLTTIETVDTNKNNNLKQLAHDKLNELNKINEERNLELLGDYRISKGKVIDFTNSDYGLNGVYLVTSATHEIDRQKELVKVSISKYKR